MRPPAADSAGPDAKLRRDAPDFAGLRAHGEPVALGAIRIKSQGHPSRGGFMAGFSSDDPEGPKKMRELLGPSHVDQSVRQAIQMCWMMLPDGRKTVDELEKQFRRIVDRAIKDLREDADAFGLPK